MKDKNAASNASNKQQPSSQQSEKGLGSKQSPPTHPSDTQNKKAQSPTSQSGSAVKPKFNK